MEKLSKDEIKSYFDNGIEPRPQQYEAFQQFYNAYNSGKRMFLFKGAVGVGKSFLAKAIMNFVDGGIISCPSKLLQAQFTRDFSDMETLVGKDNFNCIVEKYKDRKVSTAPCRTGAMPVCDYKNVSSGKYKYMTDICPYIKMLDRLRGAKYINANIHSLYYYLKVDRIKSRESLVIDECHELEDVFSSFFSCEFLGRNFPFSLKVKTNDFNIDLFDKIKQAMKSRQNELNLQVEGMGCTDAEYMELDRIERDLNKLNYIIMNGEGNYAIYNQEVKIKGNTVINLVLRPIFVGELIKRFLDKYGGVRCFFSATVNKEEFCNACGIKQDEIEYIEMSNGFNDNNAPIINYFRELGLNDYCLNYRNIDKALPKMLEVIADLHLNKFPNVKMLVHTHSGRIEKYMKDNLFTVGLSHSKCLFGSDYKNKHQMVKDFKNMESGILFSYSSYQGVDLPNDDCRIVVFCKLPFLPHNDPYIQARSEYKFPNGIENNYYKWCTALTIIQGSSRHIRNADDYGLTFFLDNLKMFTSKNSKLFDDQMHDRFMCSKKDIRRVTELIQKGK